MSGFVGASRRGFFVLQIESWCIGVFVLVPWLIILVWKLPCGSCFILHPCSVPLCLTRWAVLDATRPKHGWCTVDSCHGQLCTLDLGRRLYALTTDVTTCNPPRRVPTMRLHASDLVIHPLPIRPPSPNKQTHLHPVMLLTNNRHHISLHNTHPPHQQSNPQILRRPVDKRHLAV